jgi:hypothetical protein
LRPWSVMGHSITALMRARVRCALSMLVQLPAVDRRQPHVLLMSK